MIDESSSRNIGDSLLSVIVPVYNEELALPEFYARASTALKDIPHEILFIDDGSHDKSWALIEELSKKDAQVKGLSFSRNFGHQAALTAGLQFAAGNPIVIIDADLQDPPEVIPELLKKWQEGFDVVYGIRSERKGETLFKKWTASIFYLLLKKISPVKIPLEAGDFRLMSKPVVRALNQIPERIRFLRGLTSWVGFRQTGVFYSRDPRFAGHTKYSLWRMLRFAFDGIASLSSAPLQLASYLGLTVTGLSFLVAVYSLYIKIFTGTAIKGWTSLLTVMIFLGGIQLIMLGIIGEYISRIYEEVKKRPLYLIRDSMGIEESLILSGDRSY